MASDDEKITRSEITRSGNLDNNEKETHEIVWETGGELLLDLRHPDGIGADGRSIELVLYDASNKVVASLRARGHEQLKTTIADGGTYHLAVRDADSSTAAPGAYTVVSTLVNAPRTTYDGHENNTVPTAQYVPSGDVIRGRLDSSDTDVFRFEVNTGGSFQLPFSHPKGLGGNSVRLLLTDESGKTIVNDALYSDGRLLATLPSAGKYFLSLKSTSVIEEGFYTVRPIFTTYKDVVYEAPDNDTSASAQTVPLGRTAIGTLPMMDKDYYKFEASSGGQLSVNFVHPQGIGSQGRNITVEILDSTGQSIAKKTVAGSELFTADLADGGTHYLRIADVNHDEQPGYYTVMAGLANNGGKTIALDSAGSFSGTGGYDVVHGSTGRDTMTLAGKAAEHQIAIYPGGATVLDTAGRNGLDTLFNVERLKFADTMVAIDMNGVGGQAFRLYEAAFNRAADKTGLGFWIYQLDNGLPLRNVADGFIKSAEFISKYGPNLSHEAFVTKLYQNVLDREPDEAGVEFFVERLEEGIVSRADVLIAIANSEENVAKLVGVTMYGMEYTAWEG